MIFKIRLVTKILENILICVKQKTELHIGLEQLEGQNKLTEFSFLVELPL